MNNPANSLPTLIVVGNGMVGHRFLETASELGLAKTYRIRVFAEEPRLAYDRVNLSKFFEGKDASELDLAAPGDYERWGIEVFLSDPVVAVELGARQVVTASGRRESYDRLVLASGSRPFVPPVPGSELPGCYVYRTIDDLIAIREGAVGAKRGVVVGGGLLGLEAANALLSLGLETHVVEFAPRLMPLQVDEIGGALLRDRIAALGVHVHVAKNTREIQVSEHGRASALNFLDGSVLPTDMVIFSAGIRPRDELARQAGLDVGARGGIAIDDQCRTSSRHVFAIGECAAHAGRTYGLVVPGYRMAEVAARVIAGEAASFEGADMATKLKLLGVDVASFGDAMGEAAHSKVVSLLDGVEGSYKKLVISEDGQRLLGGILVGDASEFGKLSALFQSGMALPAQPSTLIAKASAGGAAAFGLDSLSDEAMICSCHNVTKGAIRAAIRDNGFTELKIVKKCTKAGTGCGSCSTLVDDVLKAELTRAGVAVSNRLCEHFDHTRQELFHLVKVHQLRSFSELIERHGSGQGCEICKPTVASILASIHNDHILEGEGATLQDTNDRFLANIQRDGTYSVVPRLAGGEVTPDQLIALGTIAKKFVLYTKVTGGQRIDLFGARLEQLPAIWAELVASGFESGHAYGKALRTVKSCVGSTWCRYGVQDSLGLAVRVENRYKGLRSPHKLKGAVSGCARECAEAQGKDFGIIATEKGYNLYVGGNGGMKPRHAVLLAADLDEATVVRYLDRFFMFYVRTADRLQRTATWLERLEGGIEYLKDVIINDSLGLAAELEADMAHLVGTYQCEWKTTLESPEKLKLFRAFVNSAEPDPSVVFVSERAQHRPASWSEKSAVLVAKKLRLPVLSEGA